MNWNLLYRYMIGFMVGSCLLVLIFNIAILAINPSLIRLAMVILSGSAFVILLNINQIKHS